MEMAYLAVQQEGMSVKSAAIEYNIPRSTLGDRVRVRVLPGSVRGRHPGLSTDEGKEFLLRYAAIVYPRSPKALFVIVVGGNVSARDTLHCL